jgi:hypothetical protein
MNGQELKQTGKLLKLSAPVKRAAELRATLQMHKQTAEVQDEHQSEAQCENGVCSVSWKPQRPAA